MSIPKITSPEDPNLKQLCKQLSALASDLDITGKWPIEQLSLCSEAGVFEWFIPAAYGGQGWSLEQITRGYLALSGACLTTTFIITQYTGAIRRLLSSGTEELRQYFLPDLATGKKFATVGISHLTTSRQYLKKPVLTAQATNDGFILDGMSPWVTGGPHAEMIIIAAVVMDGETVTKDQLLVAMPTSLSGVISPDPFKLIGVSASHTGPVQLDKVFVSSKWILSGPCPEIMKTGAGGMSGGLQSSTLALGLSKVAISFIENEAIQRSELLQPAASLRQEYSQIETDLLQTTLDPERCTLESLRIRSNSLVLRATQGSLAAAKGAGYRLGHPTGRWCKEALFFLVWSCPQPVLHANLCELAGIQN